MWGRNRYRIYTNSLGFKDAAVRNVPLASDAWRVVLLGDSVTEGLGYAYEDTFAGILQTSLASRGIDVLNAAVSSYSPVIYYRKMKYLIEEVKLRVNEVIVFMDISDIQDEAQLYTLSEDGRVIDQPLQSKKSLNERGLFLPPLTRIDKLKRLLGEHSLSAAVIYVFKERFLTAKAQQRVQNAAGPLGPWSSVLKNDRGNWTHDARVFAVYGERGLERAARSMDLLRDLLHKHDVALTVVVYPWPNQIAAGDRDSKQVQYWRTWAAAQGSGFVDLFGEFIDGSDPAITIRKYYIEADAHFNAAGHQRVAAAMLQRLPWAGGH
jgi:lysophospholipase L1-like esterase